jgi:hypothetical protein
MTYQGPRFLDECMMGDIIILAALRCDMHWEFRCGDGFPLRAGGLL